MFSHAYNNYLDHASGYDELQPISCQGMNTWGSFSLSLIDALDTLVIIGNFTEFNRVSQYLIENMDFHKDINVSVFETNIRVVGGLLSGHLLSIEAGSDLTEGYPCTGPLLDLAVDVARRLLPAFDTPTGMPYGTVNLMHGVPRDETPVTCTAGVGTFLVEFATLSRLTGDPIFEETALRAMNSLHVSRSKLNLLGNHLNTSDGKWTAVDATIGAGVDSYYEYLVKGSMLTHSPKLMDHFYIHFDAIQQHLKKDDWYFMAHKDSGHITAPVFQSLEAFWPGMLSLIGQIDQAKKSLYNYHQILKQFGFLPEMYDVSNSEIKRSLYPLRPEFIESLFYLYRATKDPHLLTIAAEVITAIETSSKTECGYSTVKSVKSHLLEDRMESFFLAETLKYLYLLFAPESHFFFNSGNHGIVHNVSGFECILQSGGFIFNTEAHPVDVASLDCCLAKMRFDRTLDQQEGEESLERGSSSSSANDVEEIHATSSSHSCLSREIDRFYSLVWDYEDSKISRTASWKMHHPNSCLSLKSSNQDCDFDLLSCPSKTFFSSFTRYGQMLN
jgi:mannosidase alpha-like ER degradation enhancer 2